MEDEADDEEAGNTEDIQNNSGNGKDKEPENDENMEDVDMNISHQDVQAIDRNQDRDHFDDYPRIESPLIFEPPHMEVVVDSEEGEDEYEEVDGMESPQEPESGVARLMSDSSDSGSNSNIDGENDLPPISVYRCPLNYTPTFNPHSRTEMSILSRIPKECVVRHLPGWNPMNYIAWQGNESSRSKMISKEIEMAINGLKRFVASDQGYLLIENHSANPECSLNTICNILFSCKEIRALFQDYCQNEILDLMTAIFRRDKQTTSDLRRILDETFENGVHDVRETFSNLIKQSFEDSYMSTLCSERCEHSCGGRMYRKRVVTPKGRYHVMMVDHGGNKILNLTTDSKVEMFGFKWTVILFAEFCPSSNGH
ncbi:hypothetical protein GCK72_007740 [Caenorhabditis remanei]|uniref:Uncharacterized protein n=1 Tax=Caenorhabditis remanei TaxID=31234 RepID=A0A6A5HKX3_CAERE|nr:hypothetical protein GCK72_007740 [Caenorhabditis remanei]KAF1767781.1 hypothetical protein GCK72_007740 [Caenorhabditis remanei]